MRAQSIESLTVIVRDLEVMAHIGVGEEERAEAQRLLVNISLETKPPSNLGPGFDDDIHSVLDYAAVTLMARETCRANESKLVETLADLIARRCLEDPRVLRAAVRIEKPDVISDVASVGVQVVRAADG